MSLSQALNQFAQNLGRYLKGFIERLDAYMTWYRDERIKLTFGTSIAKRRRELGLMA